MLLHVPYFKGTKLCHMSILSDKRNYFGVITPQLFPQNGTQGKILLELIKMAREGIISLTHWSREITSKCHNDRKISTCGIIPYDQVRFHVYKNDE